MTQAPAKYDRYTTDHETFQRAAGVDRPAWVRRLSDRAFVRFSELGLPTARKGNEKWKYTNVAPIARAEFGYALDSGPNGITSADLRRTAPWNDSWTNLVFVNGHYSESLSDIPAAGNGLTVTGLAAATETQGDSVESRLGRYASLNDDAFTALNTAFVSDGAFVRVPDGAELESPVHLVFVSTEESEPQVSHPRVLVVAGTGSRATVIETYIGPDKGRYFTNAVAEVAVGEGAKVDHYRLLLESEAAYHVGASRVHVSDGGSFRSGSFQKGPGLGRYDLHVLLDGPGAYCELNGLYMTSGSQHMDNLINIDHAKPHTTSRLYYKGILDGSSRAVFGGTVWVRKDAQKTDAMQSDKNLVLSPDAEVDSKPALFIYADDVKCGHGATAGNIDKETVFYMRSRGIDLETASQLLIYGFASEVIDTVKVDSLRSYLERSFLESLPTYKFEF